MTQYRHHKGNDRPNIPNRLNLSTSSQTYFLTIVTDGTNTAAEIAADNPDGTRTAISRGYARRHKRDPRNNQYGEVLAVQRAFEQASKRYGDMLDEFESHSRFSDAIAELTGSMAKQEKRERKDAKRKAARERFRRDHGYDHTDRPGA